MHLIDLSKRRKSIYLNALYFYLPLNECLRHKLAAAPQTGGNTKNWWQHQKLVASLLQVVFPTTHPWLSTRHYLTKIAPNAIIWRQHHKLVAALNGGLFLLLPYITQIVVRNCQLDYLVGDFSVKWWRPQYLPFAVHVFYILQQTSLFVLWRVHCFSHA